MPQNPAKNTKKKKTPKRKGDFLNKVHLGLPFCILSREQGGGHLPMPKPHYKKPLGTRRALLPSPSVQLRFFALFQRKDPTVALAGEGLAQPQQASGRPGISF